MCPSGCSGNGQCVGGGVCRCILGYKGAQCQLHECTTATCQNEGTCVESTDATKPPSCVCSAGFIGTFCTERLDTVDGSSRGTPGWVIGVAVAGAAVVGGVLVAVGIAVARQQLKKKRTSELRNHALNQDLDTNYQPL